MARSNKNVLPAMTIALAGVLAEAVKAFTNSEDDDRKVTSALILLGIVSRYDVARSSTELDIFDEAEAFLTNLDPK